MPGREKRNPLSPPFVELNLQARIADVERGIANRSDGRRREHLMAGVWRFGWQGASELA